MIIYKDIISGDEMFTDVYPIADFMDCFYKVTGKIVTEAAGGIDESMIGGNKSAEDDGQDDVNDSESKTGCNIVLANKLQEAPPYDKKSLMAYFKGYCKAVVSKMKENEIDDEKIAEFKKKAPEAVKYLASNLKDFQYFTGESMDVDGSVGFLNYEEDGITPYMLFFKHGLLEEKA